MRTSTRTWGLFDVGITFAGAFVLMVVAALLVGIARTAGGPAVFAWTFLLAAFLPWGMMAGWPLYATSRWGRGPVEDLGLSFRRSDLTWGVAGGVVALLAGAAVLRVTTMIFGDVDSAAGEAAGMLAESRVTLLVFAVLVVTVAPFVEELAFRGMLWAGLTRAGWGTPLTGVFTTGAFAVFHLEPVRLGVLLVVGAVLAYIRARTGRLGAPILAHAVNNLPGAIEIVLL